MTKVNSLWRRFGALLLVCVMLASFAPVGASAAESAGLPLRDTLEDSTGAMADMQFQYELVPSASNGVADPIGAGRMVTAAADASGVVSADLLDGVAYSEAGTYLYTAREVIPVSGTPGVLYDTREYSVNVTVDESLNKSVSVTERAGTGTSLQFTTSYDEGKVQAAPVASVSVENTTLAEGMFTFRLDQTSVEYTEEESHKLVVTMPYVMMAEDAFEFSYIMTIPDSAPVSGVFTLHGGEAFELPELPVGTTYSVSLDNYLGGYEFQQTSWTGIIDAEDIAVTAVVTAEPAPMVAVDVVPEATDAPLEIAVDPVPVEESVPEIQVEIPGIMGTALFGSAIVKAPAVDVAVDTSLYAINDSFGRVIFAGLTFDRPGVYRYAMSQVNISYPGVETLDSAVYDVIITVTREADGKLYASVSYAKDGAGINAIAFANVFEAQSVEAISEPAEAAVGVSADPTFTIQHFSWFNHVVKTDSPSGSAVTFVDTSNGLYHSGNHDMDHSGQGGVLPTNDSTEQSLRESGRLFSVDLTPDEGHLTTSPELVRIFADEKTTYQQNPQIDYMDRLFNTYDDYNANYTLDQVWVYQPKLADDGTVSADDPYVNSDGSIKNGDIPSTAFVAYNVPEQPRTSYTETLRHEPEKIRFTNNSTNPHLTIPTEDLDEVYRDQLDPVGTRYVSPENGVYVVKEALGNTDASYPYTYTILVRTGTVVRFVYEGTTGTKDSVSNFFDYNITDGNVYTTAEAAQGGTNAQQSTIARDNPSTKLYAQVGGNGINSSENYKNNVGTGAKVGFGGVNTLSGLDNETWNGNTVNKADDTTYGGATFGMVRGLFYDDSNMGVVNWDTGLAGLNFFGDSQLTGKFTYPAGTTGYNLRFYRQGGTYTLDGVDHNTTPVETDLRRLYVTNGVVTNDFYPMDDVGSTVAHDMMFGASANGSNGDNRVLVNKDGTSVTAPLNPDDNDHNAYFGLNYSVEFTIDPGYVAPLEYWFYGDDDMWVFLDQPGNPSYTPKLVADAGGVHNAIGEYVDLWDYVTPVPLDAEKSEIYRLTIFKDERGAYDSTCYMRFSVPLDSTVIPEQTRDEAIVIENEVVDLKGNIVDANEVANTTERYIFEGLGSGEWPADLNNLEMQLASGELKLNDGFFLYRMVMRDGTDTPYRDAYDYAIYDRSTVPSHTADSGHALCVEWGELGTASTVDGYYYFALKADEYITITNLVDGAYYTVEQIAASGYETSWQSGNHIHTDAGEENNLSSGLVYDRMTPSMKASEVNYVKFMNSPVSKTVVNGAVGGRVISGYVIDYDIQWASEEEDVVVRDRLDEDVEFIGAKFGSATNGREEFWTLSDAEKQMVAAGQPVEHTWYSISGEKDVVRYDPNYTYIADTTDSATIQGELQATYGKAGPTVIWIRTGHAGNTDNCVSLEVKVNSGSPSAYVDNIAGIQCGSGSFAMTNAVRNPIWSAEKIETRIDHSANKNIFDPAIDDSPVMESASGGHKGPYVMPGDKITYRVTWKNFADDTAAVSVRDTLDSNLTYVADSAKAYVYRSYDSTLNRLPIGDPELLNVQPTISNTDTETLTWNLGAFDPDIQGYVEFTVEVEPGAEEAGGVKNHAYISVFGMDEVETDTVFNDVPHGPVKTETMHGDGETVAVNDTVGYAISYGNWSSEAVDIVIQDTLDNGLNYVTNSASDGGVYDAETRTIIWTLNGVQVGKSGEVTFSATVNADAGKEIKNIASVQTGDEEAVWTNEVVNPVDGVKPDDPTPTPGIDPTPTPGGDEPSKPTPTPGGDEPSEPTPTPGGDEPSEPTPTPGGDEPATGGVVVTAFVTGYGDKAKIWSFVMTTEPAISGVYGDTTFTDGRASFQLKNGESRKITGIPVGTTYEITETNADSNGYTTTSTGSTGTITANGTASVRFVNHLPTSGTDVPEPTPGGGGNDPDTPTPTPGSSGDSGKIVVTKYVTGYGDTQRDWNFTLKTDSTVNGTFGDRVFTNGECRFTLKSGQSVTFSSLPVGASYTVTETEANADGYVTSATNSSGTIGTGDIRVNFINQLSQQPNGNNGGTNNGGTNNGGSNGGSTGGTYSQGADGTTKTPSGTTAGKTEGKTDTTVTAASNPKTGDNTNIGLWVGIIAVAILALGVIGIVVYRRRHTRI